ncbi:MAG: hypothetical protein QM635_02065 [Microbacteriaceae bacterium]
MTVEALVRAGYRPAFAILVLGYDLYERGLLEAAAPGIRPTMLEVLTVLVCNPYVLLYASIAWLLYSGLSLGGLGPGHAGGMLVLVRHGSRARWLAAQLPHAGAEAARLLGLVVLCALAASAGAPWSWEWGPLSALPEGAGDDALTALARTGVPPGLAWLLQAALSILVFVALFGLAAALTVFADRRRPLLLALVLAGELLGVLLLSRRLGGAAEGLVLIADTRLPLWPASPFVAAVAAIALPLAVVTAIERAPRGRSRARDWPLLVYAALVLGGLLLSAARTRGDSLAESLSRVFYGASSTGLALTSYTLYTIAFLGLPFLAVLEAERADLLRLPLLAVRHGRLWPWLREVLLRRLLAAVVLVAATLGVTVVVTALFGGDIVTPGLGTVLHQYAVNGVLQAYVSTALALGVLLATGSDRAALAVLGLLVVLGLPAVGHGWLPVGLNMTGLLDDAGFTATRGTVILALAALGLTLGGHLATTRPAPQRHLIGRIHVGR